METVFWVLGWFFCIITMIVNGFVIFLVCSQRQLRTKTNTFDHMLIILRPYFTGKNGFLKLII